MSAEEKSSDKIESRKEEEIPQPSVDSAPLTENVLLSDVSAAIEALLESVAAETEVCQESSTTSNIFNEEENINDSGNQQNVTAEDLQGQQNTEMVMVSEDNIHAIRTAVQTAMKRFDRQWVRTGQITKVLSVNLAVEEFNCTLSAAVLKGVIISKNPEPKTYSSPAGVITQQALGNASDNDSDSEEEDQGTLAALQDAVGLAQLAVPNGWVSAEDIKKALSFNINEQTLKDELHVAVRKGYIVSRPPVPMKYSVPDEVVTPESDPEIESKEEDE